MANNRAEQREGEKNAEEVIDQSDQNEVGVPVDENGDPMVKISIQATELIGLKDYSNIVVGPARVEAYVSKSERNPFSDAELKNIASALNQIGETVEVDVVAELREIALNTIDPAKRHD